MKKISWGILSTAKIGVNKVIPAMQKGKHTRVLAIASRQAEKAKNVAQELGIPKAYGSYLELLADGEIDAIYIPLPNHLHVEWTIKSLQAGKHVLCEKPIALDAKQAEYLRQEAGKFPHLKAMEAFMYRHHQQWQVVKELFAQGAIGELRYIHSVFTYHNVDPTDIRNQAEIGGGGLLDIGCYCINVSRFLFGSEPKRVSGAIEYDPKMKIDRLATGVLEFENGKATFMCSTQLADHKRVSIHGTSGRIEIENPFTPAPDDSCKITRYAGSESSEIFVEPCDHYTIQGDLFSQAILSGTNVPLSLEDSVANMKVIDGVFASHKSCSAVEI